MAKDRSLVRASDIGAWTFCQRAWWLANVRRARHENPVALERGNRAHTAHGRQWAGAGRLQRIGLALMLLGLALTVTLFLVQWAMG
jgi:hypothetical protein